MADYIDDAQAVNELHQRVAFQNHYLQREKPPADFNGKNCVECEEVIPEIRLTQHNAFRCVGCQDLHDRDKKAKKLRGY